MGAYKILIDTNVVIALEDPKALSPVLATFITKCSQHGIRLFVHAASADDIGRDTNLTRRDVSLSKLNKFERLDGIELPPTDQLALRFGTISSGNDVVDVSLLYALELGAVDFLITEDNGIHRRALRVGLDGRTFRIEEALNWVRRLFDRTPVNLPLVEEKKAHQINKGDEIFDSLRVGYPGFDAWWQKSIQEHRDCWAITLDKEIAGLIVRKDETHREAGTLNVAGKILKICTFKVKDKFRGQRFGELLLKQVVWFAQKNHYELIYVTAKPDQNPLIDLLEYFGFEKTKTKEDGDDYYEKRLSTEKVNLEPGGNIIDIDRKSYPRFFTGDGVRAFYVPIQAEYHARLFPEIADRVQMLLFENAGNQAHRPGNTIRKVYVCRAQTNLNPGDILLFYKSKTSEFRISQAVTTLGIVEKVAQTSSLAELVQITAKRSVFDEKQLQEMLSERPTPLKVIEFLLIGHIDPPLMLNQLRQQDALKHPPQSVSGLMPDKFERLKPSLSLPFSI